MKRVLLWMFTRSAMTALATAVGLAASEAGASLLHQRAYPYLNIFEPDARYGVVLTANAHTRLRSRLGRVTTVDTNAQGWRGPSWSPAVANRVVEGRTLLLGDSQAFGYGVNWEESTAAVLGHQTLCAAVPTWGPQENVRSLEELLPRFRPQHVAWVINVANDWFEAPVANTQRTTAQDGWAAHVLADPDSPTDFPFRAWFMGRSHLVLAARTLMANVQQPLLEPADMAGRLLRNLDELNRPAPPHRSRLTPLILAAQHACVAFGCVVSVAILPLDVQVHPGEWSKYRGKPADLTPVHVLADNLGADLRDTGIAHVDLLPALQAHSPGAFLPDDYHLSPLGHAVVAHALDGLLNPHVAQVSP